MTSIVRASKMALSAPIFVNVKTAATITMIWKQTMKSAVIVTVTVIRTIKFEDVSKKTIITIFQGP